MTEAVSNMDKVTQENSANSEQSAAAATQLFRLDGLSDILLPRRSASYPEWLSRR